MPIAVMVGGALLLNAKVPSPGIRDFLVLPAAVVLMAATAETSNGIIGVLVLTSIPAARRLGERMRQRRTSKTASTGASPSPPARTGSNRVVNLIALTAIAWSSVAMLLDPSPWVPSEIIETTDGDVVGYVLDEGEWWRVLTQEERELEWVPAASVTARTICVGDLRPTLLSRLVRWDRPEYRDC